MTQQDAAGQSLEKMLSYRDGFRALIRIVLLEAVVIVGLTAVLLYYVQGVLPENRYFAETAGGQYMKMTALDLPNMNVNAVLSWGEQAAVDVLTFGFNDANQRFAKTRSNFTDAGWKSFLDAAVLSQAITKVVNMQQIITAIPSGPPILLYQGLTEGKYSWIVKVPIITTTRAGATQETNHLEVRLVIVKTPTKENPAGMGIERWISQ